MTSISTYVSGHTELVDVAEFFQKKLLNPGERPIAFFDGVFYESHQERVGNIAFQDYLIYSDKAVYLWARGANKDYLDRFTLGAVSINSRNKDNDFATLNLRIRRDGKEPVYVIFDMVEIQESEKITTLHTIIESTIENYLGNNFREEIPGEIAEQIFVSSMTICPPAPLSFSPPSGQAQGLEQNSPIGYGQDLLEQYKASIGYAPEGRSAEPGAGNMPPRKPSGSPQGPALPGIPKELEGMLPTDPEALKRIAGNLRDVIGDAPFKLRDQVMKDLQHVPNDVATMLSAINELISNIADNPKAEKFVMNAIQTAVKNDGILGSVGKMLKMTTSLGPMGKRGGTAQPAPRSGKAARRNEFDDGPPIPKEDIGETTVRRKKVKIHTEDDDTRLDNAGDAIHQTMQDMAANTPSDIPGSPAVTEQDFPRQKKIKIVTDNQDESSVRPGKIDVGAESDISQSVETQLNEALREAGGFEHLEKDDTRQSGNDQVIRKKISIQSEEAEDSQRDKNNTNVYRTIESETKSEEGTSETQGRQNKAASSTSRGSLNNKTNNQG